MKSIHALALAIAVTSLGAPGWAAEADEHAGHHPEGSAAAPAAKAAPDSMEAQTQAMRQMHDKLMAARTPDERAALMAEHMKTMQDGMKMMNGAAAKGMGAMEGNMPMHQMMEKRMAMMAASMQMMMDRLPDTPAK